MAFGEVPVLVVDGGTMLWESAAIMRYLAHGTSLMPDDTIFRAVADACLRRFRKRRLELETYADGANKPHE